MEFPAKIKLLPTDVVGKSGRVGHKTKHDFIWKTVKRPSCAAENMIHHIVVGYIPFKDRREAYRVMYVSFPLSWDLEVFDRDKIDELILDYEVTFYNLSGRIQELPAAMLRASQGIGERIYFGWDCSKTISEETDSYLELANEFILSVYETCGAKEIAFESDLKI